MFKPSDKATKRTKNRFREHTIIPFSEEEGPIGNRGDEFSENVFGFKGRKCQAFCSLERDPKLEKYPRWFGWIPVDEVEEIVLTEEE
jgi:hypothetical protein